MRIATMYAIHIDKLNFDPEKLEFSLDLIDDDKYDLTSELARGRDRMRAHVIVLKVTDDFIYLADENDGAMSITNDAEAVVMWANKLYPNRRIIYRDTEGRWDELVHEDGVFRYFEIGTGPDYL